MDLSLVIGLTNLKLVPCLNNEQETRNFEYWILKWLIINVELTNTKRNFTPSLASCEWAYHASSDRCEYIFFDPEIAMFYKHV